MTPPPEKATRAPRFAVIAATLAGLLVLAAGAPIVALTGTADEVAQAAKAYRVYYAKHSRTGGYDMDHSAVIYVMDPAGRFAATFTPDSTAEAIAERLQKLLS